MSKIKILNASLLIVGTSVGAGMLGLPVETGRGGFFPSIFMLIINWAIMTGTALLFVELLAQEKDHPNVMTLSEKILTPLFKMITFAIYLLLFFSLTLAYVKGGGIFLTDLFTPLSPALGSFIFLICFVPLIILGERVVSFGNSFLTYGTIFSFITLVILGIKKVNPSLFTHYNWKSAIFSYPLVITSFGFHSVLPSLNRYLLNKKELRIAVLIGSFLTFCIYVVWQFIVVGIVPLEGENSLTQALLCDQTAISPLKMYLQNPLVHVSAQIFYFAALATSFLGVGLGLIDFLLDSFKMESKPLNRLFLALFTYLPALAIAQTDLRIFYLSLKYGGGLACFYLLVFLPILLFLKNIREVVITPSPKGEGF